MRSILRSPGRTKEICRPGRGYGSAMLFELLTLKAAFESNTEYTQVIQDAIARCRP